MVQQDLSRGDRAAAECRIASAQARSKAALRIMGVDIDTMIPVIGQHIQWSDIIGQVFRVREFDPGDTVLQADGQVSAKTLAQPYGYLLVESPILNQPAVLPICHRDDLFLASSAFDEPKMAQAVVEEAELLVTYLPQDVFPDGRAASLQHHLHYVVVPLGTLHRYYEVADAVHLAKPAPEKLFGSFMYEGELRVQANPDPHL
ncbi:MAG: hypothetical protein ABFE01_15200 [Phycisphaerales bacterium]